MPGSVAKLVSWPTAQQRAGKVVQPDSSQGALRAKRESIGWIRKIVDPQWLPDNPEESLGSKLVLLEKAYSEVDTSHAEWEKEGYRFRVSQTSTVFYLDVTPTRGKSAVGDVAAQRKAFRELASKVIQDVTDARTADGTRVAVGGTKPILMRVSFETARMRESTHGIVAQPAALDVKDTLDRRCWDFWWRRMGWCTDGQTLGLFTLKTEGGDWKANYDATGLDRGWFSPPAALLPKPAKGEESEKGRLAVGRAAGGVGIAVGAVRNRMAQGLGCSRDSWPSSCVSDGWEESRLVPRREVDCIHTGGRQRRQLN